MRINARSVGCGAHTVLLRCVHNGRGHGICPCPRPCAPIRCLRVVNRFRCAISFLSRRHNKHLLRTAETLHRASKKYQVSASLLLLLRSPPQLNIVSLGYPAFSPDDCFSAVRQVAVEFLSLKAGFGTRIFSPLLLCSQGLLCMIDDGLGDFYRR